MSTLARTLLASLLAATLICACQPVQVPTPIPVPTPEPVLELAQDWLGMPTRDEMTSEALAGSLIGDSESRSFQIVLPPTYENSDKHYPVVYVLHWFTSFPYGPLSIVPIYKQLLQDGAAREMILVFPDGSNSFGGSNYRSSPTIGDYETYIAHVLVDYVDANYRTIPERDSRGIMGGMMGGDGAYT